MDSSEAEIKRLYELIGRLFAEGRDMQSLIHQLQQSLNVAQEDYDAQQETLAENNRLKAQLEFANKEINNLKSRINALIHEKPSPNGQEQA